MQCERIEVLIGMQKFKSALNAMRCDDRVDRLTTSEPKSPKDSEVLGRLNRDFLAGEFYRTEVFERSSHQVETRGASQSAKKGR